MAKFNLEVLTPVHIGTGTTYMIAYETAMVSGYEYRDNGTNTIILVDEGKII